MDIDEEQITTFMSITGSSLEEATQWLDVSGGDMDTAFSLFYDHGAQQQNSGSDIEDLAESDNNDDSMDIDTEIRGRVNRIYESQDIYRPTGSEIESHSVNVFDHTVDDNLKQIFDIPDVLKGPYLLEKARSAALNGNPRKERSSFEDARINRDLFHDPMIIDLMQYNFVMVQQRAPDERSVLCEGNRLRQFYDAEWLPFLGILNPLTGACEKRLDSEEYGDKDRFIEALAEFLGSNPIENIPEIAPISVTDMTSNKVVKATPSQLVPLPDSITHAKITNVKKEHTNAITSKTESFVKKITPLLSNDRSETVASSDMIYRDITVDVGTENACRMRLRLPSSVTVICVDGEATVNELATYIKHLPNINMEYIDILSGNPPVSLLVHGSCILNELKLNGSAIIIRPIEDSNSDVVI